MPQFLVNYLRTEQYGRYVDAVDQADAEQQVLDDVDSTDDAFSRGMPTVEIADSWAVQIG